MAGSVFAGADVSMTPGEAFDAFADELLLGFADRGISVENLSPGSKIASGDTEFGRIEQWVPGEKISILWRPKPWEKETANKLAITFSAKEGATRVTVEQLEWGRVIGDEGGELLGWFTGEVVVPLLSASAPNRLGDWITDRHARRPSGARSRDFYGNPIYHWPNFFAILETLALGPGDHLLEVGCGGGAFLLEALKSGCRASAIDHSADMVRLATKLNQESIADGRVKIEVGEANRLPYGNGVFTCAVMTGVLGFLPDPLKAFAEVFRVLRSGGRFVAFSSTKEIRGTPAAPEPVASRVSFYEDRQLEDLARQAGFGEVKVEHPSLLEHAKRAGVPESDLELFRGTSGSQLLVCRKARGPAMGA